MTLRSRPFRRALAPTLLALVLSTGSLALGAAPASAGVAAGPGSIVVDGQSEDVRVTVDRSTQVAFTCEDQEGLAATRGMVDDDGGWKELDYDAQSARWVGTFSPTPGQSSVTVYCEYVIEDMLSNIPASVDLITAKRSSVVTSGATGETGDVTAPAGSTVRRSVTVIPETEYNYAPRIPTGSVEFLVDGVVSGSPAPIDSSGVATTDLAVPNDPGTYLLTVRYLGDDAFEGLSPDFGDTLTVPEVAAPIITTTVQTAPTIAQPVATPLVVSAVVTPNNSHIVGTVTVRSGETDLGYAKVSHDGSVSVPVGVLPIGTHTLTLGYAGDEHHTASSATVTVTVAGEPAQIGQPNVGVALQTPTPAVLVGGSVTLFGEDFDPGEPVAFFLHSDPVYLGTVVADAQGRARLDVVLPAGIPTGAHTAIATGGISGRWATTAITVSAPVVGAAPVVTAPTGTVVTADGTAARPAALAATGVDPFGAAGAALVFVLVGTALVLRARRPEIDDACA